VRDLVETGHAPFGQEQPVAIPQHKVGRIDFF
jgi:hypothetical protein